MRRDISNELVVALLAAVSLLFAGLFALLLASSTQNPPLPASPTPTRVPATETATDVVAATSEEPEPSVLASPSPSVPLTEMASATATAMETATIQESPTSEARPAIESSATPEPSPTGIATIAPTAAVIPSTAIVPTISTETPTVVATIESAQSTASETATSGTLVPSFSETPISTGIESAIPEPKAGATAAQLTETMSAAQTSTSDPTAIREVAAPSEMPAITPAIATDFRGSVTAGPTQTIEVAATTVPEATMPLETATEFVTRVEAPVTTLALETSPTALLVTLPVEETERAAPPILVVELTTMPATHPSEIVTDVLTTVFTLASTEESTPTATDFRLAEATATSTAGSSETQVTAIPVTIMLTLVESEPTSADEATKTPADVRSTLTPDKAVGAAQAATQTETVVPTTAALTRIATGIATETLAPRPRTTTLSDFLLQRFGRAAVLPARTPTRPAATMTPMPTSTATVRLVASATPSETSAVSLTSAETADVAEQTATAVAFEETASVATFTATEIVTDLLTPTERTPDVDKTYEALSAATIRAVGETPTDARTAMPEAATGIAVDTLTPTPKPRLAFEFAPTEHTPQVDETDVPVARATIRAVAETPTLTRTAAPEAATGIAVDTLRPTREPTLTDSVTPTEHTPDVEVTDKPAETATIRRRDAGGHFNARRRPVRNALCLRDAVTVIRIDTRRPSRQFRFRLRFRRITDAERFLASTVHTHSRPTSAHASKACGDNDSDANGAVDETPAVNRDGSTGRISYTE